MNFAGTIGFFDGVHRGHQYLLRQLRQTAEALGLQPVVYTFSEHPRKVLQAAYQPQLLTTLEEKRALIAEAGIPNCRVLDFTPEMARLSAVKFMEHVLRPEGVRCLLMGYDHRFGADGADFDTCKQTGETMGIRVTLAERWAPDGTAASSSRIRRLLNEGDVQNAANALGRPYSLAGIVVEGRHVGSRLGFPTANLSPESPEKLVPAHGAYAVKVEVGGRIMGGMTNVGTRPTLDNGTDVSIETHVFGLQGSLYGQPMRLHFLGRMRPERHFDSLDALRHQLTADTQQAQHILKDYPISHESTPKA